jgi:hypothetical protein
LRPSGSSPLILSTTTAAMAAFVPFEQAGHHSLIAATSGARASIIVMTKATIALS